MAIAASPVAWAPPPNSANRRSQPRRWSWPMYCPRSPCCSFPTPSRAGRPTVHPGRISGGEREGTATGSVGARADCDRKGSSGLGGGGIAAAGCDRCCTGGVSVVCRPGASVADAVLVGPREVDTDAQRHGRTGAQQGQALPAHRDRHHAPPKGSAASGADGLRGRRSGPESSRHQGKQGNRSDRAGSCESQNPRHDAPLLRINGVRRLPDPNLSTARRSKFHGRPGTQVGRLCLRCGAGDTSDDMRRPRRKDVRTGVDPRNDRPHALVVGRRDHAILPLRAPDGKAPP